MGADLPLLVVQLSGYGMPPTAPAESGWATLREAQRRFAEEDPRTALAISLDIGDSFDIHPPNKQELGRRLARAARQLVYGEKLSPSGPVPVSARREGQSVVVRFGDVGDALVAYGADGPIGFELCGTTQSSCRYARAEIRGKDEVVLRATLDAPATRVRYGWADSPVVTLFDRARLPAGPFEIELPALSRQPVLFDWFEYSGNDAVFEAPLPAGHYRNPVLAGFHPDPSITRAGDRFYLVASTFSFFPGIPVFESTDLVHWRQIGNVIDRPSQLDFDGLGISRGVFAPTIEYHDGTFYVANTAVDSGGNFIATAKDPAGPWSDPIWLPTIGGIDPSLFFDDDGRVYILNNDAPIGEPRYSGHRAIWMQEFNLARMQPTGVRKVLIDGGVDPSTNPIWIEGPHIFKRGGWYYLSCAEGGTGPQHSQVILRSRNPWGPYAPYEKNPILTQRDLPGDRDHPITNAGHAQLVETPDGRWWATFLASRNYGQVHYNTGRETFLLPVKWEDGWPMILEPGREIPYVAPGAGFRVARGDPGAFVRQFHLA